MAVPANTLADKSQPCIGFLSAFPIDSLIGDKCLLFAGYPVSLKALPDMQWDGAY